MLNQQDIQLIKEAQASVLKDALVNYPTINDVGEQFEKIIDNMLTKGDINLLVDTFKPIFATKEDLRELRVDFSNLQSSVDGFMKVTMNQDENKVMTKARLDRHEDHIEKLAVHAGVKLN